MMSPCYNSNHHFPRPLASRPLRFRAIVAERAGGFFITATMDKSQITDKDIARFWAKVDKNGPIHPHNSLLGNCWLWTAGKIKNGYGHFGLLHKNLKAHRVAYVIARGQIPNEKPLICHSCDNPSCVNPDHLFPGTYLDNNLDCRTKGRSNVSFGARNGTAKLSSDEVLEIRAKYRRVRGMIISLASEYSVSRSAIALIVKGENWKHLPFSPISTSWIGPYMPTPFARGKKLTPELVRSIRCDAFSGMKFSEIGKKFSISPQTASDVVKRKLWKHIE